VFAVPFADPVLIEVRDDKGPAAGASVTLSFEGASEPAGELQRVSDARGLVRVTLRPAEHVVSLKVKARLGEQRGSWYSTLPVVPGAMHASLTGRTLALRSPVLREAAFFSVVDERRRLVGGHVALEADGRGGAAREVQLPPGLPHQVWAVVSSEADMDAPAAVGWPLSPEEPLSTFDAKDVLVLDGLPAAFERSRQTPRRARLLAGAFALLALGLAVVLLVRQVRAADAALAGHFKKTAPEADLERFRV
jgi:hypothetical protein